MRAKWLLVALVAALVPGLVLAQTEIAVDNTGVVTRPTVDGQVLPETHHVHTILWTDDASVTGETYNVYVSTKPITDVGAADAYLVGSGIPEGQQTYEYALLTPFAAGAVANYYAVTRVTSAGIERTSITAGSNATTSAVTGTAEYGQPMFWFVNEPFIDGEFGDWPFTPVYLDPTSPDNFYGGEISGPDDMSGDIALGINDENLFFMARTTDDALVNTIEGGTTDIWKGDAAEWYVSLYDLRPSEPRHATMQWGNETDPSKAEPDYQIDIAGNAFDDPIRSCVYASGAINATYMEPLRGLEVQTKLNGQGEGGWSLEAMMPLTGLAQDPAVIEPYDPQIGHILGCTYALADGDDPSGGRAGQLFWAKDASVNNAWNVPASFQREMVIYDPKVFGEGTATSVEQRSWGQLKAGSN